MNEGLKWFWSDVAAIGILIFGVVGLIRRVCGRQRIRGWRFCGQILVGMGVAVVAVAAIPIALGLLIWHIAKEEAELIVVWISRYVR